MVHDGGGYELFGFLKMALEALMANKMRAALTMLGMVIGVGSVIALMAVGRGSQQAISSESWPRLRPRLRPAWVHSVNGVRQGNGTAQSLSTADGASILNNVANVTGVAPQPDGSTQLIGGGRTPSRATAASHRTTSPYST